MAALIEAGTDIDSGSGNDGRTPLCIAAGEGHVDIVRELLRAKANPLLAMTSPSGNTFVPLDTAAEDGHSKVVRELIQQVGIEGCGGGSGGVDALCLAVVENRHVETMALLTDAGVADTGLVLVSAAGWGGEVAVKFLLQQRQLERSSTGLVGFVDFCDPLGCTALCRRSDFCADTRGVPRLISPTVVQMLVDAGADTTSAVRPINSAGIERFNITPLACTNQRLHEKKVRGSNLAGEQLHGLEAVRRLLLRVEVVHAVSLLWPSDVPSIAQAAGDTSRTTRTTPAGSTQLTLMLPILRRRGRGVLLAPLLRYSS